MCSCKASNSWSSSVKLVDIKGKRRAKLHFSDETIIEVFSLSVLKTRFRPAGGGSGEEAVALLQEAARAAAKDADFEGPIDLVPK